MRIPFLKDFIGLSISNCSKCCDGSGSLEIEETIRAGKIEVETPKQERLWNAGGTCMQYFSFKSLECHFCFSSKLD